MGAPLSGSFATSVRYTPTTPFLEDVELGGHLRLAKNSREIKFKELGIQSRTSVGLCFILNRMLNSIPKRRN